tara:strand:- start:232 stop:1755 length:1524 start_codon:yes stop_codon:yes gene_type:complete
VATRKISDLTLLTEVSSSDTLLLLDNSDPTDQNKRTNVGSIFKSVPSGTTENPGFQFELKNNTGVFSSVQGQIGLALGDSRLSLQKVGTSLVVAAQDTADTNLDFTLQAQGTGSIRLASPLAITDTLFALPNTSDNTKLINFSAAQIASGTTRTFVFPDPGQTDTVVTANATQTLTNKTLSNPIFTGTTALEALTVSGNTTLGDNNADTLTVSATSTFASAATFSNAVQINSTLGVSQAVSLASTLSAGNTTITGTLGASLAVNFGNTLDVTGITTIDNATAASSTAGALYVTGGIFSSSQYCAGAIEATGGFTGDITGNVTGNVSGATVATTGDVTVGGNLTVSGAASQIGPIPTLLNDTKLGIGRAPTTYAMEVAGDIYFTGDNIVGGNAALDGFVIQKAVAGIPFDIRDSANNVEFRIDTSGNTGIKKAPGAYAFDVLGDSNIDGDLKLNVTDAANNLGGTLICRDITLTDPITQQTTTISATTAGAGSGVSRAKMFFHAYSSN